MRNIAHLGKKGSYSYLAGKKQLGQGNYLGCSSFRQVFDMIQNGQAECGAIPIENSLVGSIYENYDWLNVYDLHIIGEEYVRIEHCLLTVGEVKDLKTLRQVWSHPKAIEQCAQFFRDHPWIEPVLTSDTAQAAVDVAAKGDVTVAALASQEAGDIYKLSIYKKGLEDDPANYTRFVIVAKKDEREASKNKVTLFLTLNHAPGSLASVLKHIALMNINLTKIESRPYQGHPFEYLFYMDLEFQDDNPASLKELLDTLKPLVKKMKILGYYPAGVYN